MAASPGRVFFQVQPRESKMDCQAQLLLRAAGIEVARLWGVMVKEDASMSWKKTSQGGES